MGSCHNLFYFFQRRVGPSAISQFPYRQRHQRRKSGGAWVGVEQGFYRKHGLNVEVIYMRVGSLAASALVSGDVKCGADQLERGLNLAAAGLDVVIIARCFNAPRETFMARPEFKRPEDLKGKLIAIQSIGGGGWANNMLALITSDSIPTATVSASSCSAISRRASKRSKPVAPRHRGWARHSARRSRKRLHAAGRFKPGADPLRRIVLGRQKGDCASRAKIYDALLKGTIDALRFFQKPENKPSVIKTMAKHLRLNRVEDAETGYNAMVAAYSSDLRAQPEGLQKIYSILSRTNPKLSTLKPETILDSSFIQRIQSSGY